MPKKYKTYLLVEVEHSFELEFQEPYRTEPKFYKAISGAIKNCFYMFAPKDMYKPHLHKMNVTIIEKKTKEISND